MYEVIALCVTISGVMFVLITIHIVIAKGFGGIYSRLSGMDGIHATCIVTIPLGGQSRRFCREMYLSGVPHRGMMLTLSVGKTQQEYRDFFVDQVTWKESLDPDEESCRERTWVVDLSLACGEGDENYHSEASDTIAELKESYLWQDVSLINRAAVSA